MTIKYFGLSERSIFLHFLNREAYQACRANPDHAEAAEIIEHLTVFHCSGMAVNISQLLEFAEVNEKLLEEVLELSRHNIIKIISQANSMDQFISSRELLYAHDRDRYPMYFDRGASIAERFRINQTNKVSTTNVLSRQILDWDPGRLEGAVYEVLDGFDRQALISKADKIKDITISERGKAITRALYKGRSNELGLRPSDLDALARMISGIYIRHYKLSNGYATCTGIPNIEYYDDPKNFPLYDVALAGNILKCLGYPNQITCKAEEIREQRIELYRSELHREFVGALGSFIDSLAGMVNAAGLHMNVARESIDNTASASISSSRLGWAKASDLSVFYEGALQQIRHTAQVIARKNLQFQQRWNDHMADNTNNQTILLLTATDTEDDQLILQLKEAGIEAAGSQPAGNVFARKFRSSLPLDIYHVRSSAGSGGSSGSSLVTADAINHLSPDFVISVGICFGLKKNEQTIGDVVVAHEIQQYEHGRLTDGSFMPRGQKIPASDKLLSACRSIRNAGEKIHFGLIASGEKLVDDKNFVKYILDNVPTAVAGEMEGSGISAACQREHMHWIMIKSICDWGFKKNKEYQKAAADAAALFAVRLMKFIALPS